MLFLLIQGCIEPYEPDISKYEEVLVVDGTFTNLNEDHFVRLTRTYGYNNVEGKLETGAVVAIKNEEGYTAAYVEIAEGIYQLEKGRMPGIIGQSYQLLIKTQDEREYASNFETLKKPVEISNLYYEIEENIPTLTGSTLDGLQIYLDSKDEHAETHYYRWDYAETWEFVVAYDKPGYLNRYKCWRTFNSTNISIANTLQLKEDQIFKYKLNFVPATNAKLSRRYSINVKQYSLSAEAYDFWRKLELSNEHTGSLFDPPPTPVLGNVSNVNDPYEPVLGYFEVSGVSEKRIFISRSELPSTMDLTTGNEHCQSQELMGEGMEELQSGWYLLYRYEWMDTIWTLLSSHIDCYDCTQRGENSKPDFWMDEE